MYVCESSQHKRLEQLASNATGPNAQDLCSFDLQETGRIPGACFRAWQVITCTCVLHLALRLLGPSKSRPHDHGGCGSRRRMQSFVRNE